MTARRRAAGSVASVLASLVLTACAGHRPLPLVRPEPPALNATLEDLLTRLDALAAAAPAWTAEADLAFRDLARGRAREVGLRMAGRKPSDLRMQGTKSLLPTLFVLVANPTGVWLDVPSKNKTYLRPAGRTPSRTDAIAKTLLALDPHDFLRALVPDPPLEGELWTLEEEPSSYLLTAARLAGERLVPMRRLVFDRARLDLVGIRLYDDRGRLTSETRFLARDPGVGLPRSLVLTRPFERVSLQLEIRKARPGPLADDVFRFEPPAGRTRIDVTGDDPDLPAALPGTEETTR